MIRPIDNSSIAPLEYYGTKHPFTALFLLIVLSAGIAYALRRVINPENLYQKAKKLTPDKAIPLLERAIQYYHPKARLRLATLYLQSNRLDDALELIENENIAESIFLEGLIYKKKNEPLKALQKFVIASIRGYVPAYKFAADEFLYKDLKTCLNYLKRGVSANDPESMLTLSNFLFTGIGSEISHQNSIMALNLIRKAARLNSMDACNTLVQLYIRGLHNELDETEVRERLEYAANQNNVQALLSLGMQKLHGSLLYLKNPEEGIALLKKINNNPTAILYIAKYYQSENNLNEALNWYLKGAELEHPECLYQAFCITKNKTYLKKAVLKEHSEALLIMAKIALANNDIDKFIEYASKSHIKGNVNASYLLAQLLSHKKCEDKEQIEWIVNSLTIFAKKMPEGYFLLYKFYLLHEEEDKAMEELVKGSEADQLDCMKALYQCHIQIREEADSAAHLLLRIRAREPAFMQPEYDVEQKDKW